MLRAMFDGGCVPNPCGFAACACLIEDDGVEIYRASKFLGVGEGQTNNVSEYRGLLLILKWVQENRPTEIHITGDSQIVINRMKRPLAYGKLPVGVSSEIAMICKRLSDSLPCLIHFHWRKREKNEECDAMCTLEIDEEKAAMKPRLR